MALDDQVVRVLGSLMTVPGSNHLLRIVISGKIALFTVASPHSGVNGSLVVQFALWPIKTLTLQLEWCKGVICQDRDAAIHADRLHAAALD